MVCACVVTLQGSDKLLIVVVYILGEMHALWGEPGAMIDGCVHLPLMTLHAIIITDKHNTSYVLSVYKQ